MTTEGRGFLTLAAGKARYLEMAVDMALSLRQHTLLPIALAADKRLARLADTTYPTVFDEVTLIPDRFLAGRARKYGTAEASPFEETVFVDADCLVLGSLDHLFGELVAHDMAMVGERLTEEDDENHHGFSTRWLVRRLGLTAYLKTNSGLFCFRRSAALEIMEECRECFLNEARPRLRFSLLRGGWLGDEIAFGIVGGRRGLGSLPEPAPMYWPNEIEALDLSRPTKPLLHFIWPPAPETMGRLMEGTTARRAAAGVPGDAEEHWLGEVKELNRMRRRRRFLEFIPWW